MKNLKQISPKSLWIEPTNMCNLKCSFCFHGTNSMTRKKGLMSFETFKKIVHDVESFKPTLALHHSGESLIHKDIFKFIKYAKEHKLNVQMTTNGTLISKDNFNILNSGIDVINISLYGLDEEDYKQTRSKDDFKTLKRDILKLVLLKHKRKLKTKIYVNIIRTKQNSKKIKLFKKNFKRIKGIDRIIIRRLIDWGGEINIKSSKPEGLLRKIYFLMHYYYKCLRSLGKTGLCPSIYQGGAVLWDGTVVPCCFDFNGQLALGNINKDSFLSIWNGSKVNGLRKILKSIKATKKHYMCGPCVFPEMESLKHYK